jgi:nitrite reductase (NADH) large subunit
VHAEILPRILVVGNGMVGHRFVQAAVERGLPGSHRVAVLGEETRPAYDRVNLSKFFDGLGADDLTLALPDEYSNAGVELSLGDPARAIDLAARSVVTVSGREFEYDTLVLATGSSPFVPPIEGNRSEGCFVYRTLDDLVAIRGAAERARAGVVIGGGLLGLEAANALKCLGLETHVVEFQPRLMPLQVDDVGGLVLRSRIEALGVRVHVGKATREILTDAKGRVRALEFTDGAELSADIVVFSAGIRPRDELARAAGLRIGERGGIVVDRRCRTSDERVFAIGECAVFEGKVYGLVAPGYRMAETAAAAIAREESEFSDHDLGTKLKLMGVDVASFGDAFGATPDARAVSLYDGASGVYKKLVLSADGKRLMGGILVGDASRYAELAACVNGALPLPEHPEELLIAARSGAATGIGADAMPDATLICSCHNVDKGKIACAIREGGLTALGDVKCSTKAGTGCGSCVALVGDILKSELKRAGVAVNNHLCEHFAYTRQELFHLVRFHGVQTFDELIARVGVGDGCEICKPAVASILASAYNDYILRPEHAGLQDTNDRFLANIQKDGSYSIVPRIAAGEVTPDQLIALGRIAKKYGLYTKITGGQRIDMFGARRDQLPDVWRELVAEGFESGHAYGKALRTVKSCVGSTWCRYGVQDSVALALAIENRYKGLRSPHKLKGAVSGCARECAEAQSKDFGVIATEKGFNLYVCGNGGMKPKHAVLLASDIDADTVINYLDRFLMFYVRTADRLQRTAPWLDQLEGGIDYLRQVVVADSLGICAELEADMAHVISSYRCEWKATIEDAERLKMFRPFLNSDMPDPSVVFVKERGQHRPASRAEKERSAHARQVRLPVVTA